MRHYSAINLGTINNSKHLGFADVCKGNSKKIKVVYHHLAVVCPYLVATPRKKSALGHLSSVHLL